MLAAFRQGDFELLAEGENGNLLLEGELPEDMSGYLVQDVSSHLEAWAQGKRLFSRLSWADTIRNFTIIEELRLLEPTMVVEIGCGYDHPIGTMIAGQELDTHYVGVDIVQEHAARVTSLSGKRAAVGLWHDCTKKLPLNDHTVDVFLSMEMAAQAFPDENALDGLFAEAGRVLHKWGYFFLATPCRPSGHPLQHPHCHHNEFSREQVLKAAELNGFRLLGAFNYRAKPAVVERLIAEDAELIADFSHLPTAAVHAFLLPELTKGVNGGKLVPGNVLYRFCKK